MRIPATDVEVGKRYLFSCSDHSVLCEFSGTVLEVDVINSNYTIIRFQNGGWVSRLHQWQAEEIPNA